MRCEWTNAARLVRYFDATMQLVRYSSETLLCSSLQANPCVGQNGCHMRSQLHPTPKNKIQHVQQYCPMLLLSYVLWVHPRHHRSKCLDTLRLYRNVSTTHQKQQKKMRDQMSMLFFSASLTSSSTRVMPGCRTFNVYMARTIIAPSRTSVP